LDLSVAGSSEDRDRSPELSLDSMSESGLNFQGQGNPRDTLLSSSWDQENTILFNLNLINATAFQNMLGIKTKTTAKAISYASYGIPFNRRLFNEAKSQGMTREEDAGIDPDFDAVAISKANKKVASVPISANATPTHPPFLPVSELEAGIQEPRLPHNG
jgi:hypothetical protein